MLCASAARSSALRRSPPLGETRRGARHHRQRRAQVVRDRGEQGAADALGLGLDRECGLRRGLTPAVVHQRRNHQRHQQYDAEGEQVLRIVHGERALRRHEHEVECADAQHRARNRGTAVEVERDHHHREQVDHRDVDDVEARRHREADQRAHSAAPTAQA